MARTSAGPSGSSKAPGAAATAPGAKGIPGGNRHEYSPASGDSSAQALERHRRCTDGDAAALTIIEDTRQQAGKHDGKNEWWAENGVDVVRSKLAFGDYCRPPARAIDTKAGIVELAADLYHDHERFRRELEGARDAGVKLFILVENADGVRDLDGLSRWREGNKSLARRKHGRRLYGKPLARACETMTERYGSIFLFCAPEDSARIIYDILFDTKEANNG